MKEAIILAGGFGTRLQGVVNDVPKPMAPISGIPFLAYLLNYCSIYKIERVILAVGYKYESIQQYFGTRFKGIELIYAVETEPLGTGGAILNALQHTRSENVYILNGDSFFAADLDVLMANHCSSKADISIALKRMTNFDRYGSVETEGNRILKFNEKKPMKEGFINTGIYVLRSAFLQALDFEKCFSFETEVLEKLMCENIFISFVSEAYFIDIGIPEDYARAQEELDSVVKP